MAHAGLPIDVDWRNQDAVAIGKIAQVVSFEIKILLTIPYYTWRRRVLGTNSYNATKEIGLQPKS
jgi:hypothetical protein